MKKIQKFAMAFILGAMTFGFTACSDDNGGDEFSNLDQFGTADVKVNSTDLEMQKITKVYTQDVIYPTYQALAANARALYAATTTLYKAAEAGTMTQTMIDDACERFKDARREWERSESFLYGSAAEGSNNIDPHIDSWPLDHDELVSALTNAELIAGLKGDKPEQYVSKRNNDFQSVLGFHGMEFVLFRDGKNRTVDALKANDTYEGMTSVKGIDELAFLNAVAGDVKNMTALLEYTWMGSAASTDTKKVLEDNDYVFTYLSQDHGMAKGKMSWGEWLLTPTSSTGYYSWPGTLTQILIGGCSNICGEVQGQKLGQAWRVANGIGETTEEGDEESIDYIESPYSHRSFVDYKDNIYSIKNTLYGTRDIEATTPVEHSIMKFLQTNNTELYNKMNSTLTEALKSLDDATAAQGYFVANPGSDAVKNAIDKIDACDQCLNEVAST